MQFVKKSAWAAARPLLALIAWICGFGYLLLGGASLLPLEGVSQATPLDMGWGVLLLGLGYLLKGKEPMFPPKEVEDE